MPISLSPSELKSFVESNPKLVTRKESKRHPGLFVLKYAKSVFYDNLWHVNPLLKECRGLVVDAEYNVVVKPFTKVFNYGENGTMIDRDEVCEYVRKVNGFLGVVTYDRRYSNDLIYSTTGSLDSDFVDLIKKHVEPLKSNILKNIVGNTLKGKTTLMFEICDETDPHIIPEESGAWLIGADLYLDNDRCFSQPETVLGSIASLIEAKRPERGTARFSEIVKMANRCQHEGFMVYGIESRTAMKIKSPYYLITKFLARASQKKLYSKLAGPRQDVLAEFDEEFFPLIDYIRSISSTFEALGEADRLILIREFLNKTNNK